MKAQLIPGKPGHKVRIYSLDPLTFEYIPEELTMKHYVKVNNEIVAQFKTCGDAYLFFDLKRKEVLERKRKDITFIEFWAWNKLGSRFENPLMIDTIGRTYYNEAKAEADDKLWMIQQTES